MEQTAGSLVIRADANLQIGLGHFMRCLALAQTWQSFGGRVCFISTVSDDWLLRQLQTEKFVLYRPKDTSAEAAWHVISAVMNDEPAPWLLLDGYQFSSDFQRRAKEEGYRLAVMDDTAVLPHYYADVVINPGIHAERLRYSCESYSQLLLGSQFVLLRRTFLAWHEWKRRIPDVATRVLITFGGTDPGNISFRVARALSELEGDHVEFVVAGGIKSRDISQSQLQHSTVRIRFENNVTNMPELMAWADVAISGSGTTCLEMAFMGLPAVAIVLADNQRFIADGLSREGVAITLGSYDLVDDLDLANVVKTLLNDARQRKDMSERGRALVDGNGACRVATALLERNR
jgi:UDP-2,4-diacetamido-2,4,6-trideoxy-beta-L-altropyranose hydrolase